MITVSVVSHAQGDQVKALAHAIAAAADPRIAHLIVTHNLAEPRTPPPAHGWPFRFTEVFNPSAQGFGPNHNAAFARCDTPWFCVLNPDIELPDPAVWARLLEAGSQPEVGCVYPILRNRDGSVQRSERPAVTPISLLRRHIVGNEPDRPDWASAAMWLVRSDAWRSIGGFDGRYFMYCEDTDFCLRLRLAGWALARADTYAVHLGGYASRRSLKALLWHVRSLVRLWTQPTLRRYLTQTKARQ